MWSRTAQRLLGPCEERLHRQEDPEDKDALDTMTLARP
jgi:hypothetical protein